MRPGRFGKHIYIKLPDLDTRVQILKNHYRASFFAQDFDFDNASTMVFG
jgi:ATP-dependent Zn protease